MAIDHPNIPPNGKTGALDVRGEMGLGIAALNIGPVLLNHDRIVVTVTTIAERRTGHQGPLGNCSHGNGTVIARRS